MNLIQQTGLQVSIDDPIIIIILGQGFQTGGPQAERSQQTQFFFFQTEQHFLISCPHFTMGGLHMKI